MSGDDEQGAKFHACFQEFRQMQLQGRGAAVFLFNQQVKAGFSNGIREIKERVFSVRVLSYALGHTFAVGIAQRSVSQGVSVCQKMLKAALF